MIEKEDNVLLGNDGETIIAASYLLSRMDSGDADEIFPISTLNPDYKIPLGIFCIGYN